MHAHINESEMTVDGKCIHARRRVATSERKSHISSYVKIIFLTNQHVLLESASDFFFFKIPENSNDMFLST